MNPIRSHTYLLLVLALGFLGEWSPVVAEVAGGFEYTRNTTGITILSGGVVVNGFLRIPANLPGAGWVTEIGSKAFQFDDRLVEVEIPIGIVSIGSDAFSGCGSLLRVTLWGVTSIGSSAFASTPLETIVIPYSVTRIGYRAFAATHLREVRIPASVRLMGDEAFADCNSLARAVFEDLPPQFLPGTSTENLGVFRNALPGFILLFPARHTADWLKPPWKANPAGAFDSIEIADEGALVAFENGTSAVPGLIYGSPPYQPLSDTNQLMGLLFSTSTNLPLRWSLAGVSRISSIPGRWEPRTFRLPGVRSGQTVALSVAALHTQVSAPPFNLGFTLWRQSSFEYVYNPSASNGTAMVNFRQFFIPDACSLPFQPIPRRVDVVEDGVVSFPFQFGDFATRILLEPIPNVPRAAQLGTLERPLPPFGSIRYTPRPHTYGEDVVYQWSAGGFCAPPNDYAAPVTIRILPSPRRPYLATTPDVRTSRVVLRGLVGKSYTVLKSADLLTWTPWMELVGNNSEIEIPQPPDSSASAVFLTFVERP